MKDKIIKFISEGFKDFEGCGIYPKSLHKKDDDICFAADFGDRDVLVAPKDFGFKGETISAGGKEWTIAEQTHDNAKVLREKFPFTAPRSVLKNDRTAGVGDRLGIATPGHLRVFEKYDAYPILAQQSIRELNLTKRTFEDVLDSASFAVFRENFTRGFGADGDHLKTPEEVENAIANGYTMITLDCSEHIRNDVLDMPLEQLEKEYKPNKELEEKYIGKTFDVDGNKITFDRESFMRMSLIYNEAIDFAVSIYDKYFKGKENELDFEVSIDETATPTEPAQHFYVANELISRGVVPATIAPRFCGEFQKGIDYKGDLEQFEKEFKVHSAIAKKFGYKISVHSGSDKFSVFPIIGKHCGGRFHLKTAGTNWLEAMKIVAEHNPKLYREIHRFALETAFAQARKYYHVTTDLDKIPSLDSIKDEDLPKLFDNNDARQLIHITYGLILTDERFRKALFDTWREYKEEYAKAIEKHIGKHLELIYDGMKGYMFEKFDTNPYENLGGEVVKKVLSYTGHHMLVELHLKEGFKEKIHSHPHEHIGYVASGKVVFSEEGKEDKTLSTGDTYFVKANVRHAVKVLEKAILLGVFSPINT